MIGLDLSLGQLQRGVPTPQPLASFFEQGQGAHVALANGANGNLSVWTELSPNHAAWMQLDNDDPATRFSWRETLLMELRNIYPVGALTLSSGWSQLQSSGSGLSGSYTGNRAVATSSVTASASVTVDRAAPYDVWIHYTARTSGGYCRVDIDGAQTLVNEIEDPASLGFKAFPTYSDVDLQRRQSIKIASGLTGSHDIVLTNGGAASPGGNAIMIEAVAITGSLDEPRILPPLWQPGVTYEMGDEVQFGGLFYSARANGVSGNAGPTHTGGIASDGALDWRADNRPTYPKFIAIDYASEREYAMRFTPDVSATELGGQTHGNETLQARTIQLDGAPWVPSTVGNGLSVGAQIAITEDLTWQLQTGEAIGDCQLVRTVTPGQVYHAVNATGTGTEVAFEWFYAGMLPMVRWDGESGSTVIDSLSAPSTTPVALTDYAGTSPANIDFPDAQRIGLLADLAQGDLVYGLEAGALPGASNVVNDFDTFLRPNLDASSESGSLDWKAKAYITGSADGGLSFGAGDALRFYSRHVLKVT
ncbi:hypothetical protein [Yoonia sp. BS5-3]|uniref:Uncharacterized protein n=1 Tax=Yoonia phaeophyticola TaxID=3137369 RepID=A0ABZ2V455_9RHOB